MGFNSAFKGLNTN